MAELSVYQLDQKEQLPDKAEKELYFQLFGDKVSDVDQEMLRKFNLMFDATRGYKDEYYTPVWDLVDDAVFGNSEQPDDEDEEDDFRSTIRMREGYIQEESMTSKVVPSLLGNEPPISVDPIQWTEEKSLKAYVLGQRLHYNFLYRCKGVKKVIRWVKSGSKYGLGIMKLFWLFDFGWKNMRQPVYDEETGELAGYSKIRGKQVRQDRPCVVNVSPRNFWWNPDAECVDDIRWVVERYYRPIEWLQSLGEQGIYKNTDDLAPVVRPPNQPWTSEENRTGSDKYIYTGEDMVEVYELWTPDYQLTVGNRDVILAFRDNPYDDNIIPYYFYNASMQDENFVGIGEVEPILDLEEGENSIRNMRLDNVNRIINRPLLVGATAGIKGKKFQFKPGVIIRAVDRNQVGPLEMPDVTSSSYLEEEKFERQIDKTNGNPEIGRGEQGKRSTATGDTLRLNSANLRTDLKVQVGQTELGRLYQDMYRLERQFGDKNRVYRAQGEDGLYYDFPHDMLYDDEYEFYVRIGGYIGNKITERQQFLQFEQVMLSNEEMTAEYDMRELARVNASLFPMIINPNRILKKPMAAQPGFQRDAGDENARMLRGEFVPVLVGDPHGEHITDHLPLLTTPGVPEEVVKLAARHQNDHQKQLLKDQRMQGSVGGNIGQAQMNARAFGNSGLAGGDAAQGFGGMTQGAVSELGVGSPV